MVMERILCIMLGIICLLADICMYICNNVNINRKSFILF